MKSIIQRIVMAVVALCASLTAFANDFRQDGIYYYITSKENRTVMVTSNGNYGCYSGDIEIPQKVIYKSTTYTVTEISSGAFQVCRDLTSVIIPNSVTRIGGWAFTHCSNLTSVTIPKSVTDIGSGIFASCANLEVINVHSDNPAYCSMDSILYSKDMTTIISCPGKKKSLTIPETVTTIGSMAIEGCSNLTSVTIPNSVTAIGTDAFQDCSGLTSITIPKTVTIISSGTFWGCSGLTSVTIPNSITSIDSFAFYDCSSLTSVTIPNSVTSIGKRAFAGCSRLEAIYSQIVEPFECEPGFSDANLKNTILYVPTGTLSAYEKVDPWRNFWNIEEKDYSGVQGVEPEGVSKTEIGRYNLQGLEVRSDYKGLIVIKYSDGSYCKQFTK